MEEVENICPQYQIGTCDVQTNTKEQRDDKVVKIDEGTSDVVASKSVGIVTDIPCDNEIFPIATSYM